MAQEEEPQELQPPPPMGVLTPESLLENEVHLETARLAGFLQVGQEAGSLDLLKGRISSKFVPQS